MSYDHEYASFAKSFEMKGPQLPCQTPSTPDPFKVQNSFLILNWIVLVDEPRFEGIQM